MPNLMTTARTRPSQGPFKILRGLTSSILLTGCFTFGSNATTGQTAGTEGETDDGAGDELDETEAAPPEPEPFEHRVFIGQHLEYDNLDMQGAQTYQVSPACLNTDIPGAWIRT
jgi:hypothetical protein